jgi:hypothetical protein
MRPYVEIRYLVKRCRKQTDTDIVAAGIAGTIVCVLTGKRFSPHEWRKAVQHVDGNNGEFLRQIESLEAEMPQHYYGLIKTPDEHPEIYLGEQYQGNPSIEDLKYLRSRSILIRDRESSPAWDLTEDFVEFGVQTSLSLLLGAV